MKNYASNYLLIGLFALVGSSLSGEEVATCKRCQIIREENAKKGPPEYKYYDDYLRAEEAKKTGQKTESSTLEEANTVDPS